MATTRKTKPITCPTPDELAALEQSYLAARAIPIMHLVNQFYSPNDAKSAAAGDQKAQFPLMTRNEAFERLHHRFAMALNAADQSAFKAYIEKLRTEKSPSSNQRIILGLAHLHGYGPKQEEDADAAFIEFELASKTDDNNEYAHTLLGERYFYKKGWFGKTYNDEALACFNKAIAKAPQTLGHAYGLRGWIYNDKNDKKQALNDAKQAAVLSNQAGINLYCSLIDDDSRKAHLAKLISIEGNTALYAYYLDQRKEAATKMYELAAVHGNYAGIYNAANHIRYVRNQPERAARYYCAVLFFPVLQDKHLEAGDFLATQPKGRDKINYYLAIAHDDTYLLHHLLEQDPKVFIALWKQDYEKPLHPKIQERVIAYACKLEPGKVNSAKTCQMLAAALSACSEPDLKRKGRAFSLAAKVAEAKPHDLTHNQNKDLADALRASLEKSLNDKAKMFEVAAETKRKEEEAAKLAAEKARLLELPRGVVAQYTVAATGRKNPHSINASNPEAEAALALK